MSAAVFAGPEDWSFVQSVGGIAVDAPTLHQWGWVWPVRADVSGLQGIATKPTTLNPALVCIRTDMGVQGRNIYLTVVTAPPGSTPDLLNPKPSSRCPPVLLGEMLPGKYSVFYRGPNEAPVPLGEVSFGEDGPADPAKVAKVIGKTDKIVVFEDTYTTSKVLFSSTSVKDIAEFNDALSVVPPPPPPKGGGVCACAPVIPDGPVVRLYSGGTELVLVSNVHRYPAGTSRWGHHTVHININREKWLRWFDARNIDGAPYEKTEAELARDNKAAATR